MNANRAFYEAVNRLMAQIGADGEVSSRDKVVTDVMEALARIDGGRYQNTDYEAREYLKFFFRCADLLEAGEPKPLMAATLRSVSGQLLQSCFGVANEGPKRYPINAFEPRQSRRPLRTDWHHGYYLKPEND